MVQALAGLALRTVSSTAVREGAADAAKAGAEGLSRKTLDNAVKDALNGDSRALEDLSQKYGTDLAKKLETMGLKNPLEKFGGKSFSPERKALEEQRNKEKGTLDDSSKEDGFRSNRASNGSLDVSRANYREKLPEYTERPREGELPPEYTKEPDAESERTLGKSGKYEYINNLDDEDVDVDMENNKRLRKDIKRTKKDEDNESDFDEESSYSPNVARNLIKDVKKTLRELRLDSVDEVEEDVADYGTNEVSRSQFPGKYGSNIKDNRLQVAFKRFRSRFGGSRWRTSGTNFKGSNALSSIKGILRLNANAWRFDPVKGGKVLRGHLNQPLDVARSTERLHEQELNRGTPESGSRPMNRDVNPHSDRHPSYSDNPPRYDEIDHESRMERNPNPSRYDKIDHEERMERERDPNREEEEQREREKIEKRPENAIESIEEIKELEEINSMKAEKEEEKEKENKEKSQDERKAKIKMDDLNNIEDEIDIPDVNANKVSEEVKRVENSTDEKDENIDKKVKDRGDEVIERIRGKIKESMDDIKKLAEDEGEDGEDIRDKADKLLRKQHEKLEKDIEEMEKLEKDGYKMDKSKKSFWHKIKDIYDFLNNYVDPINQRLKQIDPMKALIELLEKFAKESTGVDAPDEGNNNNNNNQQNPSGDDIESVVNKLRGKKKGEHTTDHTTGRKSGTGGGRSGMVKKSLAANAHTAHENSHEISHINYESHGKHEYSENDERKKNELGQRAKNLLEYGKGRISEFEEDGNKILKLHKDDKNDVGLSERYKRLITDANEDMQEYMKNAQEIQKEAKGYMKDEYEGGGRFMEEVENTIKEAKRVAEEFTKNVHDVLKDKSPADSEFIRNDKTETNNGNSNENRVSSPKMENTLKIEESIDPLHEMRNADDYEDHGKVSEKLGRGSIKNDITTESPIAEGTLSVYHPGGPFLTDATETGTSREREQIQFEQADERASEADSLNNESRWINPHAENEKDGDISKAIKDRGDEVIESIHGKVKEFMNDIKEFAEDEEEDREDIRDKADKFLRKQHEKLGKDVEEMEKLEKDGYEMDKDKKSAWHRAKKIYDFLNNYVRPIDDQLKGKDPMKAIIELVEKFAKESTDVDVPDDGGNNANQQNSNNISGDDIENAWNKLKGKKKEKHTTEHKSGTGGERSGMEKKGLAAGAHVNHVMHESHENHEGKRNELGKRAEELLKYGNSRISEFGEDGNKLLKSYKENKNDAELKERYKELTSDANEDMQEYMKNAQEIQKEAKKYMKDEYEGDGRFMEEVENTVNKAKKTAEEFTERVNDVLKGKYQVDKEFMENDRIERNNGSSDERRLSPLEEEATLNAERSVNLLYADGGEDHDKVSEESGSGSMNHDTMSESPIARESYEASYPSEVSNNQETNHTPQEREVEHVSQEQEAKELDPLNTESRRTDHHVDSSPEAQALLQESKVPSSDRRMWQREDSDDPSAKEIAISRTSEVDNPRQESRIVEPKKAEPDGVATVPGVQDSTVADIPDKVKDPSDSEGHRRLEDSQKIAQEIQAEQLVVENARVQPDEVTQRHEERRVEEMRVQLEQVELREREAEETRKVRIEAQREERGRENREEGMKAEVEAQIAVQAEQIEIERMEQGRRESSWREELNEEQDRQVEDQRVERERIAAIQEKETGNKVEEQNQLQNEQIEIKGVKDQEKAFIEHNNQVMQEPANAEQFQQASKETRISWQKEDLDFDETVYKESPPAYSSQPEATGKILDKGSVVDKVNPSDNKVWETEKSSLSQVEEYTLEPPADLQKDDKFLSTIDHQSDSPLPYKSNDLSSVSDQREASSTKMSGPVVSEVDTRVITAAVEERSETAILSKVEHTIPKHLEDSAKELEREEQRIKVDGFRKSEEDAVDDNNDHKIDKLEIIDWKENKDDKEVVQNKRDNTEQYKVGQSIQNELYHNSLHEEQLRVRLDDQQQLQARLDNRQPSEERLEDLRREALPEVERPELMDQAPTDAHEPSEQRWEGELSPEHQNPQEGDNLAPYESPREQLPGHIPMLHSTSEEFEPVREQERVNAIQRQVEENNPQEQENARVQPDKVTLEQHVQEMRVQPVRQNVDARAEDSIEHQDGVIYGGSREHLEYEDGREHQNEVINETVVGEQHSIEKTEEYVENELDYNLQNINFVKKTERKAIENTNDNIQNDVLESTNGAEKSKSKGSSPEKGVFVKKFEELALADKTSSLQEETLSLRKEIAREIGEEVYKVAKKFGEDVEGVLEDIHNNRNNIKEEIGKSVRHKEKFVNSVKDMMPKTKEKDKAEIEEDEITYKEAGKHMYDALRNAGMSHDNIDAIRSIMEKDRENISAWIDQNRGNINKFTVKEAVNAWLAEQSRGHRDTPEPYLEGAEQFQHETPMEIMGQA